MKVNIEYGKEGRTKCKIKIDQEDLWSGDLILAKVIYQFLKKFKKTKRHSWPMAFVKHLELYEEETTPERDAEIARLDKEGQNQWEECLDKMIYSFYWISMEDAFHDFPESKALEKKKREVLKPYRKELSRFDKGQFLERSRREDELAPHLREEYMQYLENHRIKVDEGLVLFGKYFRGLCD